MKIKQILILCGLQIVENFQIFLTLFQLVFFLLNSDKKVQIKAYKFTHKFQAKDHRFVGIIYDCE